MVRYVAVPGTWAWRDRDRADAWFNASSPFAAVLETINLAPLRPDAFLWTTRLNGTDGWRRWLRRWIPRDWENSDHLDWQQGAHALRWYCEVEGGNPDVLIAHSHGGQVAAYAIAAGWIRPRLLVTVSTPPRADMTPFYELVARATTWRHVYATDGDLIQWGGNAGDGRFDMVRRGEMPEASLNVGVPGAGHATVLHDPRFVREFLVAPGVLAPPSQAVPS